MWQQNVTNLLSQLGWGSGFRLPIANKENLHLERELEKKQRTIQERQAELDDILQHNSVLEKGIQGASDLITQEIRLSAAKKAEILAESTLFKRAEAENNRLETEKRKIQGIFFKAYQSNELLCNEIETRKTTLSELVQMIEYNREELVELQKKAEEQDVHLHMLEQVCQDDEDTLRKFQTRYHDASVALGITRRELENQAASTLVAQSELEGLSDRFRKLHRERGDVVSLWKGTLSQLSLRDVEMKDLAEEYGELNSKLKEKDQKLESKRCKLKERTKSASTASMQLNRWDKDVGDIREAIKNHKEQGQMYRDSVLTYETTIQLTSAQIQELCKKTVLIDSEINEMNAKVIAAQELIENLKIRADGSKTDILSVEDHMRSISELVDEEQLKLENLAKNLEKEMWRKSQWGVKKNQLKNHLLELDHKIRVSNTAIANLSAMIKEKEFILDSKKSSIYKIEISLIAVGMKHKKLNPKLYDAKLYSAQEDRILELRNILKKILHDKTFIENQASHLDNVNRRIYRERNLAENAISSSQEKTSEHRIYIKLVENTFEKLTEEHKNSIYENSLIKLKLSQMIKALSNHKNLLYDTEHERELLCAAAKEKKCEIEEHSKLLAMQKRELKESVISLKIQFTQVSDSIKKKRARYEIIMRLMSQSPSDVDPDDDLQSEAYYVLKMAQEKELLRREGDNWDKRVKEAEKETEALQNSLSVVQCSNDMFKDSLKPMMDGAIESELTELKDQEKKLQLRKRKATTAMSKLYEEIKSKEEEIETLVHQRSHFENKLVDREYQLRCLQGDLNNQAQTGRRARLITSKILQLITFSGPEEKQVVSLDIRFRATRTKLDFALRSIGKVFALHPRVFESVAKLLLQDLGDKLTTEILSKVTPRLLTTPTTTTTSNKSSLAGLTLKEMRSRNLLVSTATSIMNATKDSQVRHAHVINKEEDKRKRSSSENIILKKVINVVNQVRTNTVDERRKAFGSAKVTPSINVSAPTDDGVVDVPVVSAEKHHSFVELLKPPPMRESLPKSKEPVAPIDDYEAEYLLKMKSLEQEVEEEKTSKEKISNLFFGPADD